MHWNKLFDQSALLTATELGTLGLTEAALPPRLQRTTVATGMTAGNLPANMRIPAGEAAIVRVQHLDPLTFAGDNWVTKTWLNSQPDATPGNVTGWLTAQGRSWTTAAQWRLGYTDYMTAVLQNPKTIKLSPVSGMGVELMDGILNWYAGLSGGSVVLLGNPAGVQPIGSVDALQADLKRAGQGLRGRWPFDPNVSPPPKVFSFNDLHADLTALTATGLELAPFAQSVRDYFSGVAPLSKSTTVRSAAALLQGAGKNILYTYISRLLVIKDLPGINALPAPNRASVTRYLGSMTTMVCT